VREKLRLSVEGILLKKRVYLFGVFLDVGIALIEGKLFL
jgi:hypothetical protein